MTARILALQTNWAIGCASSKNRRQRIINSQQRVGESGQRATGHGQRNQYNPQNQRNVGNRHNQWEGLHRSLRSSLRFP